ncbi:hypothetical protein BGZ95_006898, partial [Linnemannia exigua]
QTRIEGIKEEFFQTGSAISNFLRMFVEGELSLPEADCCVKGLAKAWMRSSSFAQKSARPALYLLHPTQPHQTTSTTTPPSVAALEMISNFQNSSLITFFGVSGCRKPRAVVEMLAQTWGFYLNGSQADRGSKDITTLYMSAEKIPARYFSSDKVQNGLNMQAITGCLLISRLIVLQHCLNAYHDQTPVIPLTILERLLQDQFRQIQGQITSYTSDSLMDRILVVLDEAQTLSDHGKDFFVSRSDTNDTRSLLSPVVRGLRNILSSAENFCVVTCGAGIGADGLEVLLDSGGIGSGSMVQVDRRIVDFPGWETVDQVAMYINNLGDLMCEMRGNLCSDIKRMLDKVAKDPAKFKDALDLKHVLKQTVVLRASLGLPWSLQGEQAILVESAFGRLRIVADKAAAGKTTSTIIDEPFVFQAAYNFIKNEEEGFYNLFRDLYRDLQDPQSEGKIFERHAPLDLIYAFHKKQLKQELFSIPKAAMHTKEPKIPIPQFEPVTFLRRFFENPATIVGWEGYEWGARYKETFTMGDFLEAHYRHGSRRGDSTVSPFYYPESSPSGPDIVFVLQIDDQLYPVFVQNKLLNKIFPGDVEEARLTVHASRIKAYLPNLATYCPGGKYLSLIYAHPGIVKTPREGWNSDDLWASESEIGTDRNQVFKDGDVELMQLLMIIDGNNMHDYLAGEVVELLDSVKGTKRVHQQLGSSDRANKKPMLTKQPQSCS